MNDEQKPIEIKRSISYNALVYEASQFHGGPKNLGPFYVFDQFPITEIRKICLATIRERLEQIDVWEANWFESRILSIRNQNKPLDRDDIWEELLAIYIGKSQRDFAVRALEFAINLGQQEKRYELENCVAKLVTKKICDSPELYTQLLSIKRLVEAMLNAVDNEFHQEYRICDDYGNVEWKQFKRALTIILAGRDISYLSRLEDIAMKFDSHVIAPDTNCELMAPEVHKALIKGVIKQLKKIKKAQLKDVAA